MVDEPERLIQHERFCKVVTVERLCSMSSSRAARRLIDMVFNLVKCLND